MTTTYAPGVSEFALPVLVIGFRCQAATPIAFVRRPSGGAFPGTTLAGAFGHALVRVACRSGEAGGRRCSPSGASRVECGTPDACDVPVLHKPRSALFDRDLPPCVLLRSPELERSMPARDFSIEVTLVGRRAVRRMARVIETVREMASSGLIVGGAAVPVRVVRVEPGSVRQLRELRSPPRARTGGGVQLEFETPMMVVEAVRDEVGAAALRKEVVAGGELPLASILGNLAYDLVAMDLTDRERTVPRQVAALWADTARALARDACRGVVVTESRLYPADAGVRRSGSNGKPIALRGFMGEARLEGDLAAAWPWIEALAVLRGGQKRSLGLGQVRVTMNRTGRFGAGRWRSATIADAVASRRGHVGDESGRSRSGA